MNNLFNTGKQVVKKKVLIWVLSAVVPFFLIIIALILVVSTLSPVINALSNISDFFEGVTNFNKAGSIVEYREFAKGETEKSKKLLEAEEKIKTELDKLDKEYKGRGAQLDLALLATTVRAPSSITYDEATWIDYNEEKVSDEYGDDANHISRSISNLKELARNMVSIYETKYNCVSKYDEENDETYYVKGSQISSQEYIGKKLPKNNGCSSASDTAVDYSYIVDIDKYDNYLLNNYLPETRKHNNEYDIPESLSGDNLNSYLQQIVYSIHDMASIVGSVLGFEQVGHTSGSVQRYTPTYTYNDSAIPVQHFLQTNYKNVLYAPGKGFILKNRQPATISSHGCGPTSMSIILSSLLERTVSPVEAMNWACNVNNMRSGSSYCYQGGTNVNFMCPMANAYGLKCRTVGKSPQGAEEVVKALESGNALVVAYMGPGAFTSGGHYIVLRGVLNSPGNYKIASESVGGAPYMLVADPASTRRSEVVWSMSLILSQIRATAGNSAFVIISR